ncbi:MAG: DNA-binding response regulator [Betaproteobacteria bacterium]|nr:MAG: DNA-binding response regulator [Betaproteobacteria bacterium]
MANMKIPDDTQTICVVDDDEGFRDSLVWLLQAAGHRVASFASGEGFLSHWRPETPGCLLVDIRMPGMTGLELQVELERRGYGAPVIFITGHGDVPMAVSALRNGAFHFLEKPFNDESMLAIVEQALAVDRQRRRSQAHRAEVVARVEKLTPREREVMNCVIAGKLNKVTADELGVSIKTVEAHRSQLMRKLEVDSTAALIRLLLEPSAEPVDATIPDAELSSPTKGFPQ